MVPLALIGPLVEECIHHIVVWQNKVPDMMNLLTLHFARTHRRSSGKPQGKHPVDETLMCVYSFCFSLIDLDY